WLGPRSKTDATEADFGAVAAGRGVEEGVSKSPHPTSGRTRDDHKRRCTGFMALDFPIRGRSLGLSDGRPPRLERGVPFRILRGMPHPLEFRRGLAAATLVCLGSFAPGCSPPTVEADDPIAFREVVSPGARLDRLATSLGFTEGPVWS